MTDSGGFGADGIRCMQMRGGSSNGAYFLAEDLPADADERDDLLLRVLGSPDSRQIDGLGGGHPLTSKVAVVRPSVDARADVDYLFLQIVSGGRRDSASAVEAVRRAAGPAMGLGDVVDTTVPKVTIVSPPRHGGTVTTRTFIPHRVHAAIGVLGAVSVAAGIRSAGTVFSTSDDVVRIESVYLHTCDDVPYARHACRPAEGVIIDCRLPVTTT